MTSIRLKIEESWYASMDCKVQKSGPWVCFHGGHSTGYKLGNHPKNIEPCAHRARTVRQRPLAVSGAATSLATESVECGVVEPSASVAESSTAATGPATGSHQIDYCRTALVADQSHRVCCTPPQHTVRWEWEACVQSSFPASFVCAVKTIFLLRTSDKKCKKQWVLALNRFVRFL